MIEISICAGRMRSRVTGELRKCKMVVMFGRRNEGNDRHAPPTRTMRGRAVGAAPRDGRVETQERVDTLDRKVGTKRETFPWRGPAEIRHRASRRQLWLLYGKREKKDKKSTGGASERHMRL